MDKHRELINGFTTCARNDIFASRMLFLSENYPLAVYHATQAIEKIIKTFCIELDDSGAPIVPRSHEIVIYLLKRHIKNPKNSVSDASVENAIKFCSLYPTAKIELAKSSSKEIQSMYKVVRDAIKDSLPNIQNYIDGNNDLKGGHAEELQNILLMLLPLVVLSIILSPHDQSTRYPDQEIRPWDYTPEMGVVECLPDILEWLDEALNEIEEPYNLK